MGLTFVVGAAADVFPPEFARSVHAALRSRYEVPESVEHAWQSEPLDPAGWRALGHLAASMLHAEGLQLAAVDAYQAVWVPQPLDRVDHLAVENAADPLQVASLPVLLDELRRFAAAASLPTDDVELMQLAAHYMEDELSFDKDPEIQTYVQCMLAAKQASARRVPLWIAT